MQHQQAPHCCSTCSDIQELQTSKHRCGSLIRRSKQHLYTSAASRSMTYGLPPSRVRSAIRASWKTRTLTISFLGVVLHMSVSDREAAQHCCVRSCTGKLFCTWHANAPANGTVSGLRRSGSFACRQESRHYVLRPGLTTQCMCSPPTHVCRCCIDNQCTKHLLRKRHVYQDQLRNGFFVVQRPCCCILPSDETMRDQIQWTLDVLVLEHVVQSLQCRQRYTLCHSSARKSSC